MQESSEIEKMFELCMVIAFEAGRWHGQVDLEEHFYREQYSSAIIESLITRRTSMPMQGASSGRTVSINLRSDEWRNGVKKSTSKKLEFVKNTFSNFINKEITQPSGCLI